MYYILILYMVPFVNFALQATSKQQVSTNWKFHIPDLKVGTLDQLVGLSDDLGEFHTIIQFSSCLARPWCCQLPPCLFNLMRPFLGKVDAYVEQVTHKVAAYLGDVLEDQRERLVENLVANGMDLATLPHQVPVGHGQVSYPAVAQGPQRDYGCALYAFPRNVVGMQMVCFLQPNKLAKSRASSRARRRATTI